MPVKLLFQTCAGFLQRMTVRLARPGAELHFGARAAEVHPLSRRRSPSLIARSSSNGKSYDLSKLLDKATFLLLLSPPPFSLCAPLVQIDRHAGIRTDEQRILLNKTSISSDHRCITPSQRSRHHLPNDIKPENFARGEGGGHELRSSSQWRLLFQDPV